MTNEQLAKDLNDRVGLTGENAITANVIRQWVGWDVLPKASAKGQVFGTSPEWSRSGTAKRRALRLAELRKFGVKREFAVIVQAYIEWGHPDFDRVRDALRREWQKQSKQLSRGQTTFIGNAEYPELSATKKRAIANQIGPLDGLFAGTNFAQTPEFYATFAEIARTGKGNSKRDTGLIAAAFEHGSRGIGQLFSAECNPALAASFSGMTGSHDEIGNSCEIAITDASEREFRIARIYPRLYLKLLRDADHHSASPALDPNARQLLQTLHLLGPQISIGPWATFAFAQALNHVFQQSELRGNSCD